GNATILNSCSYPLYIWSQDSASSAPSSTPLLPNTIYREPLRAPCLHCGVSLKISKNPLHADQITQFEYSLSDDAVWYDISLIDCVEGDDASHCPGHEAGLQVVAGTNDYGCGKMECKPGETCKESVYYVPVPGQKQPVGRCNRGAG
ncbi:uncharacterized protein BDR25DRAFT_190795, partial [Lindgomyces ingoldianus]